jgi:hypothetical protein
MTANHTLTSISLPRCSLSVPADDGRRVNPGPTLHACLTTNSPIFRVQWLALPQAYQLDSHVGAVRYTRGVEKQTEI